MMKMTKISSMSRRRLLLLWVLLVLSILLPLTQSQQPPPPQQQEECFSTIASLQGVMATELSRIANGGAVPAASYTFILCPNTFLDASTMPLQPLLDKSTFMCGNDGHVRNRCVIVGNGSNNNNTTTTTDAQVRIVDSTTPGHVLQQVDFIGLTFTDFTSNNGATSTKRIGQSIAAAASTSTTATFKGCAWQVRCLVCGVSSSSLRRGYCFFGVAPGVRVFVCLFVCLFACSLYCAGDCCCCYCFVRDRTKIKNGENPTTPIHKQSHPQRGVGWGHDTRLAAACAMPRWVMMNIAVAATTVVFACCDVSLSAIFFWGPTD
jgi:hypothetical protein